MSTSPLLQLLNEPVAAARGVRLLLWRDDLAHPDLPGNKARKLKYNLAAARQQGHRTLLTFGGAYSNHIAAVAAAGRLFGFKTIGLIRGRCRLLRRSATHTVRPKSSRYGGRCQK